MSDLDSEICQRYFDIFGTIKATNRARYVAFLIHVQATSVASIFNSATKVACTFLK
jgi:hypothetical protein